MRIAAVATLYTTSGYVIKFSVQNFVHCIPEMQNSYCRVQNDTFALQLKYHESDPDRCVQSVFSLKNKSAGLSCGFSLNAGFLLHPSRETAHDRPTNIH